MLSWKIWPEPRQASNSTGSRLSITRWRSVKSMMCHRNHAYEGYGKLTANQTTADHMYADSPFLEAATHIPDNSKI